eukprot:TRINITY_DN892_c0_g1_i1.p1 TRINITY_DN892_c0_g1~~TRINITY_DN892_c0_g1_i1.p1  ORF type:complete len:901 (-),score=241.19 TRINITY_DN892_c0_g1_i1:130-2787(-)
MAAKEPTPEEKATTHEEPAAAVEKNEESKEGAEESDIIDSEMSDKKEEEKEDKKEPEEKEVDAPADSRAKVKHVGLNLEDSTLNVMPTAGGRLLQTLSEGGMQFLLASVRANTGLRAGRYMFEARIVENLCPSKGASQGGQGDNRQPRQVVRLGFSTAGSSLFLGDGPNNCCFDSEGFFLNDKTRKKCGQKFIRDYTAAVLLNLDPASPNANTISLFVNGVRASQPQSLPEALVGKALFPTITYNNVSVEVNFGPACRAPLPFACRMVGDAAAADTEATKVVPSKGKHQVVFPIGLPEQGYFDWVDEFCEKNPCFTELSDRKIIEWASKSGVWRPKSQGVGSNDKPEAKLGVPALDDWSVRKVIAAVAPVLPRSYIVPELKSNLIAAERGKALKYFMPDDFERKAVVVMGEPSAASKERVQTLLLREKKDKIESEKKKKAQEEERKRLLELKKAKAEEAKKQKEAAQRKKEGKEEEAPADEKKEDEKKEEDVKMEEPEMKPELTEDEKKLWYRKLPLPDITETALSKSYASFTLPTKDEGFDAVAYEWQSEQDCAALMKSWILEKKLTQRAEDLVPGSDFKEKWTKWQKTLQEWRKRQSEFKDPAKRKALQAKKIEAAKKAVEEEKKSLLEAGSEDAAKELEDKAVKAAEPKEIDIEELDVFSVEDVMDVGNGEPLFANFAFEDWTLLSLRYELHLLLHSFKKDLNDPDRTNFGDKHFGYYYNKYFKKNWNLQQFVVKKFEDVLDYVKDTVTLGEGSFLKAQQAEEIGIETFVKLTEDHRRERERRVDAGDETAKLKFNRPAPPPSKPGAPPSKGGSSGKGGSSSYGNARGSSGGSSSYGSNSGSSYGSQKRTYSHAAPSYSSKAPRTGYSSEGYGSGNYGGYRR